MPYTNISHTTAEVALDFDDIEPCQILIIIAHVTLLCPPKVCFCLKIYTRESCWRWSFFHSGLDIAIWVMSFVLELEILRTEPRTLIEYAIGWRYWYWIPPRRCIIGTGYWRLETGVWVAFLCLFQYGITQGQSSYSFGRWTACHRPVMLKVKRRVMERHNKREI